MSVARDLGCTGLRQRDPEHITVSSYSKGNTAGHLALQRYAIGTWAWSVAMREGR